ncbi:MAG: 16S rRNA (adenine(1518)-N(6)/adenine(1519)-N(6))-dimethyltransferase, partial [Chitinophagaceae bacterium]|nr:16S rRNA (adenine(1518)-N(6)/adenine(1519)-N(6))-dimethyltransferase [Chitinophagaceae bacterium]
LLPNKTPVEIAGEKQFYLLVKTAINQRRKTLRNAVRGLFTAADLEDSLFDKRAEQLTVQQFAALSFRMK